MPNAKRARTVKGLLWVILLVVGCSRPQPSAPVEENIEENKLVVFAAASLRDAFTMVKNEFMRSHPGVEVTFNFAGTQELRTQLEHGAKVDVFASADRKHIDDLLRGKQVDEPVLFARNEPVIVVAKEAAQTVRAIADLPKATRIVVGAPEAPIGRYTLQIFDRAGSTLGTEFRDRVEAKIVSRELNVRQVLTKVRLGEAHAGIVYRTDAQVTSDVTVVTIPAEMNVIAEYPIAVVSDAAHPNLARAWVDVVLSDAGQNALKQSGFLPASTAR